MSKGNDIPKADGSANVVCVSPATVRIEIYTPRGGEVRGHLDGVLYRCEEHAGEIVEVIGWDTGGITTYRSPLHDRTIRCGSGWDFVAGAAIEPAAIAQEAAESPGEIRTGVTDLIADDNPAVSQAIFALTFGGWLDLDDIPRDRAALLLDCWADRACLNDQERDAVLAQFPETATRPGTEVIEAYELGQALERTRAEQQAIEDLELLERVDRRLRAKVARHAFTVRATGAGDHIWTCICGEATVVEFHDDEGDVREQLVAHLKATTPAVAR